MKVPNYLDTTEARVMIEECGESVYNMAVKEAEHGK